MSNEIIGIYCWENIQNEKRYIGQSVNVKKRYYSHKYSLRRGDSSSVHLQSAWNKYGEDSFKFYILEECMKEELNKKEIYWINKFNSTDSIFGYNCDEGGSFGGKSDESKIKCSISNKNLRNSKRKNPSSNFFGVQWVEKTNRWNCRFNVLGKTVRIREFDFEEDAARMRDKYIFENNLLDYPLNFEPYNPNYVVKTISKEEIQKMAVEKSKEKRKRNKELGIKNKKHSREILICSRCGSEYEKNRTKEKICMNCYEEYRKEVSRESTRRHRKNKKDK